MVWAKVGSAHPASFTRSAPAARDVYVNIVAFPFVGYFLTHLPRRMSIVIINPGEPGAPATGVQLKIDNHLIEKEFTMLKRFIGCTALLLLMLAGAVPVQAQDAPPTLLVQVRSLETVLENIKLLVALSGRENIANQVEGLIKAKIGPKGLEGIDLKRPFGAYGQFKALNDGRAVALIPILDETAFLDLLKNLNLAATKNARTGIYTITGLPAEIYLRFADKYAYVTTINVGALEADNLVPAQKVFRAAQQSAISLVLRLDQLPKEARFLISAQFEQKVQDAQEKKIPGESEAQKALRLQVSKEIIDQFNAVINEGEQLSLDLDIDKQAGQMSLGLSLTALPKTGLAKSIAEIGKTKSLFANLRTKESAVHGSLTMGLPKSLQKLFADAIEDAQVNIVKGINDPGQRKHAEELLKALSPTFKAGELDGAISIQGPDGKKHYNIIAGVKVHEGAALSKTMHRLLAELREQIPPGERNLVQLEVATIGGAKVHRFDLGKFYGEGKEVLGESPLLMAVSDDAIYYAVGPDAMLILRVALTKRNDVPAAPLSFELSLARLWPLLPASDKNREKLQELFPPGKEGSIRFTIEGGSSLSVRVSSHLSLLQFMGAAVDKK